MRSDRPLVSAGYLVVVEADQELTVQRQGLGPVLFVGEWPVEVLNSGRGSGRVVGIVPVPLDLLASPIFYAVPDFLPESLPPSTARALAGAAGAALPTEEAVQAALEAGGSPAVLSDRYELRLRGRRSHRAVFARGVRCGQRAAGPATARGGCTARPTARRWSGCSRDGGARRCRKAPRRADADRACRWRPDGLPLLRVRAGHQRRLAGAGGRRPRSLWPCWTDRGHPCGGGQVEGRVDSRPFARGREQRRSGGGESSWLDRSRTTPSRWTPAP